MNPLVAFLVGRRSRLLEIPYLRHFRHWPDENLVASHVFHVLVQRGGGK